MKKKKKDEGFFDEDDLKDCRRFIAGLVAGLFTTVLLLGFVVFAQRILQLGGAAPHTLVHHLQRIRVLVVDTTVRWGKEFPNGLSVCGVVKNHSWLMVGGNDCSKASEKARVRALAMILAHAPSTTLSTIDCGSGDVPCFMACLVVQVTSMPNEIPLDLSFADCLVSNDRVVWTEESESHASPLSIRVTAHLTLE